MVLKIVKKVILLYFYFVAFYSYNTSCLYVCYVASCLVFGRVSAMIKYNYNGALSLEL